MDRKMSANPQFNFLRTTFKVVVSVSLFSFVISQYSSLILPLLLQSADEFSSSFSVNHLFRYSSDRNIVFLLCNGILVFIITNSGVIAAPPRSHESRREKPTANPKVVEVKFTVAVVEEEEVARKKGDETHERVISIHHHHHQEEEESKEIVTFSGHHHHQEEEEEEERKKGDDEIVQIYSDHYHHHEGEGEGGEDNEVGGDDDDDEEEGDDELEKKCEEFIKRMKRDMMRK